MPMIEAQIVIAQKEISAHHFCAPLPKIPVVN